MENYRTTLSLKVVKSTRFIKLAKIATCHHYACYEQAKKMMKKAIANGYTSVTMNVTLAEDEYKKFCELVGSQGLNVDIKSQDEVMRIVTQVDVFVNVND